MANCGLEWKRLDGRPSACRLQIVQGQGFPLTRTVTLSTVISASQICCGVHMLAPARSTLCLYRSRGGRSALRSIASGDSGVSAGRPKPWL